MIGRRRGQRANDLLFFIYWNLVCDLDEMQWIFGDFDFYGVLGWMIYYLALYFRLCWFIGFFKLIFVKYQQFIKELIVRFSIFGFATTIFLATNFIMNLQWNPTSFYFCSLPFFKFSFYIFSLFNIKTWTIKKKKKKFLLDPNLGPWSFLVGFFLDL